MNFNKSILLFLFLSLVSVSVFSMEIFYKNGNTAYRKHLDKHYKIRNLIWYLLKESTDDPYQRIEEIIKKNKMKELDVFLDNGRTLLGECIMLNKPKSFSVLIEHGANINKLDRWGRAPLHYAAMRGSIECVKIIIGKKGKLNVRSYNKETPLLLASCYGHHDIAKILLIKGADHSLVDYKKRTPLFWACVMKHDSIMDLFSHN